MIQNCNGSIACTSAALMLQRSPSRTATKTISKEKVSSKHDNESYLSIGQLSPFASTRRCKNSPRKPLYDVFLGGSCGNTVWRRDQVIPYLEKRAISYYDPQRSVWNEHMINEESVAKENSSLFLFVLDPATLNATSFLEIAHFAARKAPKLVVVFLGRSEWRDKGHPDDLSDRQRSCDLLENILSMHNVPVLQSIQEALHFIDEMIIGEKSWSEAMSNPLQRLPYMLVCGKKAIRNSKQRIKTAWKCVKNNVIKWKGTKYALIGLCEIFFILMVHCLIHGLPIVIILVPLLALDVLIAVSSLIYSKYKIISASKRQAKLLQQRMMNNSVPIPGRAIVPCSIVPQQLPLTYCSNSKIKATKRDGSRSKSIHSLQALKYCSMSMVDPTNPLIWRNGFDVYLGCSSRKGTDLSWISQVAAPQLHKKGLSFCSELSVEWHKRLTTLDISRRILYHIPSCESILSGMVEVAYFLGHTNWNVTLCVPKRAKFLDYSSSCNDDMKRCVEQRNECYRMAFCYLRDMAERRHCEIFSHLDDALQYVLSCSKD